MYSIKATITHFTSLHQPGFVECRFTDAYNKTHLVEEKLPVITSEDLGPESTFPKEGWIGCIVIKQWTNEQGQEIVRVSTEKPRDIESSEGLNVFDVFAHQLRA